MPFVSQSVMLSEDTAHRVATDGEVAGQRSNRPSLLCFHNNKLLFQIFPVVDNDGHMRSSRVQGNEV